jgi:sulfide:quinone oxidoreductase
MCSIPSDGGTTNAEVAARHLGSSRQESRGGPGGSRSARRAMKPHFLILGAGFGGLELSTLLSEALGDSVAVTLIDRADAFVFGSSKLDVLFGRATASAVLSSYARFVKRGVTLRHETVTAIDPVTRRVTTNVGTHVADTVVIALGAEYDVSSTPGITLGENEFYSLSGAVHLRKILPSFTKGHAVIGVCGAPYKCPPAPSECALLLHDSLVARGVRNDCRVTLVNPLSSPVPPSPETSKALIAAFAERDIDYLPNRRVASVDSRRKAVVLDDGRELPCELFLGVPKNRASDVVVATGLTENGWVTVDQRTLQTKLAGVYAIGDIANSGAPKAGVFAETAARTVAANLVALFHQQEPTAKNPGAGSCYIEFGADRIARVDIDFFSGPKPTGAFHAPSRALRIDKEQFGASRQARWFGQ